MSVGHFPSLGLPSSCSGLPSVDGYSGLELFPELPPSRWRAWLYVVQPNQAPDDGRLGGASFATISHPRVAQHVSVVWRLHVSLLSEFGAAQNVSALQFRNSAVGWVAILCIKSNRLCQYWRASSSGGGATRCAATLLAVRHLCFWLDLADVYIFSVVLLSCRRLAADAFALG